jgi:glycerol uptake facilitator-like aquaporin
MAITDAKNMEVPKSLQPLYVGLLVLALNLGLGMNCACALNPARDLGPRIYTAAVGWGWEYVFSEGDYWFWVPLAATPSGGLAGAGLYMLLVEGGHRWVAYRLDDDLVKILNVFREEAAEEARGKKTVI